MAGKLTELRALYEKMKSRHARMDSLEFHDALGIAFPDLAADYEAMLTALRAIAGERQWIDNLMGDADIARETLAALKLKG